MPILRRLKWYDAHGDKDSAWPKLLSEMLEYAMSNVRRVTDGEFIALTDQLDRRTQRYERQMSAFARQLEKDGPLSASAPVEAIGLGFDACSIDIIVDYLRAQQPGYGRCFGVRRDLTSPTPAGASAFIVT